MLQVTPVVKNLLIINIAMFAIRFISMMAFQVDLNYYLGLFYFGVPDFQLYQLITNFFMHGNLPHIAFNMISLYSIGFMLERVWGGKRFLNFYMICGLGAGIIHLIASAVMVYSQLGHIIPSPLELSQLYGITGVAVGASGAIFGLFTAVALTFPNSEFYLMFIPVPIKAKYLWVGLVIVDIYLGIANYSADPIGHFAHIGGVITGFLLVKYYNKDKTKFY